MRTSSLAEIPLDLQPEHASGMFPDVQAKHIPELQRAKIGALGVAAAIFNTSGQLLVLEHKKTKNLQAGMLGPLSETSKAKFDEAGNIDEIEALPETLWRGFEEEVGVTPPVDHMYTKDHGAWVNYPNWIVRDRLTALALTPVIHLKPGGDQLLKDRFKPTTEIQDLHFMHLDTLRSANNLRPNVQNWLDALPSWFSHIREDERAGVILKPSPMGTYPDALFGTMVDNDSD